MHSMTVAPQHNNNNDSILRPCISSEDHASSIGTRNDCNDNDNDYDTGSFADWQSVRRAANDQRGGDRWKSRGVDGIWHRWHTSPRVSLFTPYRVAKGPASSIGLHQHRFTYGVTSSGRTFEFHDDWTKPERAHMVLDEPWLGYTVFIERGAELMKTQDKRPQTTTTPGACPGATSASTSRWADA